VAVVEVEAQKVSTLMEPEAQAAAAEGHQIVTVAMLSLAQQILAVVLVVDRITASRVAQQIKQVALVWSY
tara:strand:- start:513 stop:722 length:210 start_codon:yes stop_codon:yes gene_type:complete